MKKKIITITKESDCFKVDINCNEEDVAKVLDVLMKACAEIMKAEVPKKNRMHASAALMGILATHLEEK